MGDVVKVLISRSCNSSIPRGRVTGFLHAEGHLSC
jgi:hypothetical protein